MPRGLFRKITPRSETLHSHWALKPFKRFLGDPRLWSLQRRTVTPAFGAGLAICFVPLPIHIPLAVLVAIFCRINIPTIMAAVEARFGAPSNKSGPVGNPPITKWFYPTFVVVFENDKVLHAVVVGG